MSRVLLHVCCGPCATVAAERLRGAGHIVTLFFSNGNLATPEEHDRRLEAALQLADRLSVPLLVDRPDHAAWLTAVRGLEREPEGGARCRACFRFSLARAAARAAAQGMERFTTSLTTSPHKDAAAIAAIGRELDAERYLATDFKQDGGFQRSVALSRAMGLYRQNHCGCEFSQPAAIRAGG